MAASIRNIDDFFTKLHDKNPTIKTSFPEVYGQLADKYDGDIILGNSSHRLEFDWVCTKCKKIHKGALLDKYIYDDICPFCRNENINNSRIKEKPFKTLYPRLERNVKKKDGLLMDDKGILYDTTKIISPDFPYIIAFWTCDDCGEEYKASIEERINNFSCCPFCTSFKSVAYEEYLNFSKNYPELESNLVKDYHVNFNLNKIPRHIAASHLLLWSCPECEMNFEETILNRINSNKSLCPYCNEIKAIPGKTSIKALYPYIVNRIDNIDELPFDLDKETLKMKGDYVVKHICNECKMEYDTKLNDLVYKTNECPYCSEQKVNPIETSLYARYSDLVNREWLYRANILLCNPYYVFPNSTKMVWWKCPKCHKNYKMPIKNRVMNHLRGIESCLYCNGRTRKKNHF